MYVFIRKAIFLFVHQSTSSYSTYSHTLIVIVGHKFTKLVILMNQFNATIFASDYVVNFQLLSNLFQHCTYFVASSFIRSEKVIIKAQSKACSVLEININYGSNLTVCKAGHNCSKLLLE